MPTVRYAQTRLRVARTCLVRLDPHLSKRETWTRYVNVLPRRCTGHTTRGATGTGR